MRRLALALPLLALGACAGIFDKIEEVTTLTKAELGCIFTQVTTMSPDTPKLAAAMQIGEACGIDAARIGAIFLSKFGGTVEVDGETVVVDKAARSVAVVE